MTLQLLIVPAIIAAILWFFVKPDKPLIVSEEHVNNNIFQTHAMTFVSLRVFILLLCGIEHGSDKRIVFISYKLLNL